MSLVLVFYGNPLLRKKSEPVGAITDEIKQLALEMIDLSDNSNGIGVSAVQVGRAIRLFVCRSYLETEDGKWTVSDPQVYINPQIISHSVETIEDVEGCLSIPNVREKVERPLKITIEAMDLSGKLFREELEGYNARIRMHENDHLNGVLFIDRISSSARKKLEPTLRAIKSKYNKA